MGKQVKKTKTKRGLQYPSWKMTISSSHPFPIIKYGGPRYNYQQLLGFKTARKSVLKGRKREFKKARRLGINY